MYILLHFCTQLQALERFVFFSIKPIKEGEQEILHLKNMSGDLGGSLGPPMQEDARLARNIEAGRQLAPGNLARQVSKADTTQSRPAASLDSVNSSSLGQFCPVDEESHSPISQRQGSGSASLSNSSSFVNVGLSLSPPESSASLNTVDAIAARTPDSSHGNAFSGFGPGSVPTGIAGASCSCAKVGKVSGECLLFLKGVILGGRSQSLKTLLALARWEGRCPFLSLSLSLSLQCRWITDSACHSQCIDKYRRILIDLWAPEILSLQDRPSAMSM